MEIVFNMWVLNNTIILPKASLGHSSVAPLIIR